MLVMPLSSNFAQSPQVPAEAMTAEQIFKLPSKEKTFTLAGALAQFEVAADDVYRLGEGG